MKLTKLAIAPLAALLLAGCGSNSSNNNTPSNKLDLPNGKTLIFFDNKSSQEYLYNTDTEEYENMNADANNNYNMTNKHGKLITIDEKIVMLHDDFNINEGNLTSNDFHYLGHFHTEDENQVFAAHSHSEFDEATASDEKKTVLNEINAHLLEQEDIKQEISEALPSGEELCNFFVFDHDHNHEDNTTTEEPAHLALTKSGKVYVFKDGENGLISTQSAFALDGITNCEEDESSIIPYNDHGVLVFSANSQKLYDVDSHGMDFHQHSSFTASKFLPKGFTPTQLAGLGEGEDDHDDE